MIFFSFNRLKDGRLPTNIDTHVNAWKAEEFQKFAFPAMEFVLNGLLDQGEFHIFQLMARMVELVFNKVKEWDHDDVLLFGNSAKRFNLLIEENVGLHACIVTAHNLIHVDDDIFRFLFPENYCIAAVKPICKVEIAFCITPDIILNPECLRAPVVHWQQISKIVDSSLTRFDFR